MTGTGSRLRDRSIFVGQPDDIVAGTFGAGLPEIRGWTEHKFDFAGYVTDQAPPTEADRARLRTAYGYRSDERICLVSVGGSGVGEALLRRDPDALVAALLGALAAPVASLPVETDGAARAAALLADLL